MKSGASRFGRTVRSLGAISALGVGLAAYNAYSLHRDVGLATGSRSEAQHEFFVAAVDRPDIALFFKGLTHAQRMTMAERIGQYDDPKLAALVGTLLGAFDSDARAKLTTALTSLGHRDPAAVAEQLKQKGSLQQFAIASALRSIGNSDLPSVVRQLKVEDARPNAVAYLVAAGRPSVPLLLPYLGDADQAVRLAAADALGKIGDPAATAPLLARYQSTSGDEHLGYLSAISAIGSPQTEALLSKEAGDPALSTPRRADTILGLGRIGTATAAARVASFANDDDVQIRDAAVSALQLAGNVGLKAASGPSVALKVAAGIKTPEATAYIARMLADPGTMGQAADVGGNRPELVSALVAALRQTQDGAAIDAAMRALATTPPGVERLRRLESDPVVGGFAMRQLKFQDAPG